MANGMGSLYIGASGMKSSQNALNTTANNLANVDTKGYVRQQVIFADQQYSTFDRKSAVSWQQSGLGVTIGDMVHTRDNFLDKYYRNEAGRQAFYERTYETVNEVEDLFQELEGATYQNTLNDFWVSFQELSKSPDSEVNQNLVIQKAVLFIERSKAINDGLKSYQKNLNVKISDNVNQVNNLGKKIQKLNMQIQKIEAGGIETAMTLRDERDNALDELSTLVSIDYKEGSDGIVKVSIEGVDFIDEVNVHQIELQEDKITGFLTPYWPQLSNTSENQYDYVFDFGRGISSSNNTDIGKLKALVYSRGESNANYTDVEGKTADEYNSGAGRSVIMKAQAELDQLIHTITKSINDLFCPNKTTSFTGADGKVYNNVKVWDEENGAVGSDGKKPGNELFVRKGTERYTEVTADDGKVYYVYNEESSLDSSKQYTVENMKVNPVLQAEESNLPYKKQNGEIDVELAKKLQEVWSSDLLTLNPNDTDPCTFTEYYHRLMDDFGSQGSVFSTLSTNLAGSVSSIDNQRQQVIGVASDEELTNMIKYQNAYNAASRYINVISEMIEHIVTQLGA